VHPMAARPSTTARETTSNNPHLDFNNGFMYPPFLVGQPT
jgi:hypothetical protein